MKLYSTKTIANYFIQKAKEENIPLTPMKLIKLVFFAHGLYLALHEKPLIDESFEAWKFGPVTPTLFQSLKIYAGCRVTDYLDDNSKNKKLLKDDANAKMILNAVWGVYKDKSGYELSEITHEKGSPWYETWHNDGGKHSRCHPISDVVIMNFYKKEVEQAQRNG